MADRGVIEPMGERDRTLTALAIVRHALEHFDDPRALGAQLAVEIRRLSGAKAVMLFQCHEGGMSSSQHRVVSVSPRDLSDLAQDRRIKRLIELRHGGPRTLPLEARSHGNDLERIVASLGLGEALTVNLSTPDQSVGHLLILGHDAASPIASQTDRLQRDLSEILALVIRNSLLLEESRGIQGALVVKEEKYRHLVEQQPELVLKSDLSGRIIYVSPSCCQVLCKTEQELVGESFTPFLHEDDRPAALDAMQTILRPPHRATIEQRVMTEQGWRWFSWSIKGILGAGSEIEALIAVGRDVTDRRELDEERRRLDERMQRSHRLESLGLMAGGIAHDFNNLLTGILGNTTLAQDEVSPGSTIRDCLDQIEISSLRAADLCKQMLAYSGRGQFVLQTVDLSKIIRDMLPLLKSSISKKIRIRLELHEPMPGIRADVSQIRQIVANLSENAAEAIGDQEGEVTIATGIGRIDTAHLAESFLPPGLARASLARIEVRDTGCGMTAEIREQAFEPFFSTKFTGRGLGLSAVLGIVRGHHGAIEIRTDIGHGTRIRVHLPPSPHATLDVGEDSNLTPWEQTAPPKILVVDDEVGVRHLAQRSLQRAGIEVILAGDGAEAVRLFEKMSAEVNAVLLDLTMPQMDGVETFQELRRIRSDIRIVISSGYSQHELAARFAGLPVAGFLQKPYRPKEIVDKIHRALRGR